MGPGGKRAGGYPPALQQGAGAQSTEALFLLLREGIPPWPAVRPAGQSRSRSQPEERAPSAYSGLRAAGCPKPLWSSAEGTAGLGQRRPGWEQSGQADPHRYQAW